MNFVFSCQSFVAQSGMINLTLVTVSKATDGPKFTAPSPPLAADTDSSEQDTDLPAATNTAIVVPSPTEATTQPSAGFFQFG